MELNANDWPIPAIFTWLKCAARITDSEMLKTFNCGLGMVLIVAACDVESVMNTLRSNGETCNIVGKVTNRQNEQVIVNNFSQAIVHNQKQICTLPNSTQVVKKKNVAVLISGTGTNLKAIIDYVNKHRFQTAINIALVISDKKNAPGLKYAQDAAILTKVIAKKKEYSREEYDQVLHQTLLEADIEFVCLAGFMRILSDRFVSSWLGKMINIHPSLLPSFKGIDAYGQALKAGVKLTGCTVHFVTPEMDAGPIIAQDIVKILPNDTRESLSERGKTVEHLIYPPALESVVSGKVSMCSPSNEIII